MYCFHEEQLPDIVVDILNTTLLKLKTWQLLFTIVLRHSSGYIYALGESITSASCLKLRFTGFLVILCTRRYTSTATKFTKKKKASIKTFNPPNETFRNSSDRSFDARCRVGLEVILLTHAYK